MKSDVQAAPQVAIIGMSGLFAGAGSVTAYWSNILAKRCCIEDAPEEWSNPAYDPNSTAIERVYTRKAGFLGSLAEFDPLEFGVVPNAVPASEPDHFMALREAAGALRDAGYMERAFNHETTGIILGRGATPNRALANGIQMCLAMDQIVDIMRRLIPGLDDATLRKVREDLRASLITFTPESAPGQVSNVAVGRIANRLDLMGPSYMVDAACSSSLIALEGAVRELASGRCDMMLVGGVQGSMPPPVYMLFCQLGALSRTMVRPFDEAADGTLLGEGCGFVVVKRLEDAERDGDRIYAVVKGLGVASDGKALGLLAPRVEGEALAMRRAYEQTGIDPTTIELLEAHGTGIALGDRTEVQAMSQVFGGRGPLPRIAVGSVKSMIGHCIPAAGIAGLIKVSLALYHKMLPPTLCEKPSTQLGLEKSPFYVITRWRPWIRALKDWPPRRAAVSAMGFGGINAHAILEEYRGTAGPTYAQDEAQWPTELMLFSGADRPGVAAQVQAVADFLRQHPDAPLAGLSAALAAREPGPCRLAIVASDVTDLLAKMERAGKRMAAESRGAWHSRSGVYFNAEAAAPRGRTALMFPGQGSQYPYMLADLCRFVPLVREEFDRSDTAFEGIWKYRPSEYVFPPPGLTEAEHKVLLEGYYMTDVATETVFTAALALHRLLKECGVEGDLIFGHSSGEYCALAASGSIVQATLDQQIAVKRELNRVYREFKTTANVPRGALLTVGAVPADAMAGILRGWAGRLYVAMDNCPNQQVVFGSPETIREVEAKVREIGGLCQELPFNYAYHTPLMSVMREVLSRYYGGIPLELPHPPLFSCSTLDVFPDTLQGIRETALGQWMTTVRFREAILKLHEQGVRRFIEVGPASVLTGFVHDILRDRDYLAMPCNERNRPSLEQFQRLLGQLFVECLPIRLSPLFRHRRVQPLDWTKPIPPVRARPTRRPLDLAMRRINMSDAMIAELQTKSGTLAAASGSEAQALLASHFALMSEWLASQRRWAEALFPNAGKAEPSEPVAGPRREG
jgi:acyl transferase domain-containing protein